MEKRTPNLAGASKTESDAPHIWKQPLDKALQTKTLVQVVVSFGTSFYPLSDIRSGAEISVGLFHCFV